MQYLDRRNRRRSVDIRQGVVRDRDERQQPATLDPSRRPRPIRRFYVKDRIMLITVCRLYDSYPDAHRVIVALEAAGLPPSETSVISNNSYTWYSAAKNANVVPLQKDSGGSKAGKADGKVEGATVGAAIGATAATAASLVTMLAIPGVGAVIGAGWLSGGRAPRRNAGRRAGAGDRIAASRGDDEPFCCEP
jgi:hypothetical protein